MIWTSLFFSGFLASTGWQFFPPLNQAELNQQRQERITDVAQVVGWLEAIVMNG